MKKLGILFLLGGLTVLWHVLRDSQPLVRPTVHTTPPVNTMVPAEPGAQEVVPLQRLQDYYAPHYEGDELVWEARGKQADVYGEHRVVVGEPHLTFYEKRRPDGSQKQVRFRSRTGEINKRKGLAQLNGAVTAETEDGTRLDAASLLSEFAQKRVFTDDEVTITRPKLEVRGRQLDSSIKLEKFSLRQGVRLVMRGHGLDFIARRPAGAEGEDGLDGDAAVSRTPTVDDPAGEEVIIVTSDGPLTMERLEQDERTGRMRHRITVKENVLLLRQHLQEVTTSLATDTLEIVLLETKGAGGNRLDVEILHSSGNTRLGDRRGEADSDSLTVVNESQTSQTMSFSGPYKWFTLDVPDGFSLAPTAPDAARAPASRTLEITCAGNARFVRGRKGDGPAQIAEFENQVLVRNGAMSLLCRKLEVEFAPSATGDGMGAPEVSALIAAGDVLFVDDQITARSDRLDWDRVHQGIRLSGDRPAEVLQNQNRLAGRLITMDQSSRRVTCEGDSTATVQLPADGGAQGILPGASGGTGDRSWTVRSRRQVICFGEGMKTLESLDARGDVTLEGSGQRAHADQLRWLAAENRMVLEGKPYARITDRDHSIESEQILISPKQGLFQLVGKKLVTINHVSGAGLDRRLERISITCEGSAVLTDGGARMHFLREVSVKRATGRITCDRMLAFINTERNEVERVVANGNVLIADPSGTALAAYLAWNMSTREFLLRRHPYAQVWHEGSYFFGEEISASQDWRNVTAVNKKGRGRIVVREGSGLKVPGDRPAPTQQPPADHAEPRPPRRPPTTTEPTPTEPSEPAGSPDRRRPDRR